MQPLHMSDLHKQRQEELAADAEAWRMANPCRHSLRYRAGSRLLRFGRLLMGEDGS